MSVMGYIYVGDPDLERLVRRIEPLVGAMTARDDGVYVSADGYTLAMVTMGIAPPRFASEVHLYAGTTDEEQHACTLAVFELLRSFGDVALEANHEMADEPLATFDPPPFSERWTDDDGYVLLVREVDGRFEVFDPQTNAVDSTWATYAEAENELSQDEFHVEDVDVMMLPRIATRSPTTPVPEALHVVLEELATLRDRGELTHAAFGPLYTRAIEALDHLDDDAEERFAHLEAVYRFGELVGCRRE